MITASVLNKFRKIPPILIRRKDYRTSQQRYSIEKNVLKNFIKFIGKQLCQTSFLINLQDFSLKLYKNRDSGTVALL